METRMKSKKDVDEQIQRIYNRFVKHRLYGLAQELAILYNWNMSNTANNELLYKQYSRCFGANGVIQSKKEEAKMWLDRMHNAKYPKALYAKRIAKP